MLTWADRPGPGSVRVSGFQTSSGEGAPIPELGLGTSFSGPPAGGQGPCICVSGACVGAPKGVAWENSAPGGRGWGPSGGRDTGGDPLPSLHQGVLWLSLAPTRPRPAFRLLLECDGAAIGPPPRPRAQQSTGEVRRRSSRRRVMTPPETGQSQLGVLGYVTQQSRRFTYGRGDGHVCEGPPLAVSPAAMFKWGASLVDFCGPHV